MSTKKTVEKLKDIKNLELAKETSSSDSGIESKNEQIKSKNEAVEESSQEPENMEIDNG